jgi:hypothetical protein
MSAAHNHLYGAKWRRLRLVFLSEHPWCAMHERRGTKVPATVVDHIVPHDGDLGLFWDQKNWQGLCKHCHDAHKQRLEKSGREIGCDVSGIPLDPNHPWNKG